MLALALESLKGALTKEESGVCADVWPDSPVTAVSDPEASSLRQQQQLKGCLRFPPPDDFQRSVIGARHHVGRLQPFILIFDT